MSAVWEDDTSVTEVAEPAASQKLIGEKENSRVAFGRALVFLVLFVCTTVTGILTFRYAKQQEHLQFIADVRVLRCSAVFFLQPSFSAVFFYNLHFDSSMGWRLKLSK